MDFTYLSSIILCGILSVSQYIKTRKPYKLLYVLFWVYFCIGMPILERIASNTAIESIYLLVGIVLLLIFIYRDIVNTKKSN